MPRFLYNFSDPALFLFLGIFFMGISILSLIILRFVVPYRFLYRNNAVLGNVASLIGIIYGVLAGLSALYLLTNITSASAAVQNEANAAANLYRDTHWIKGPAQVEIQNEISQYLDYVIKVDWPLMADGLHVTDGGDKIIDKIVNDIYGVNFSGPNAYLLSRDMSEEAKGIYNARQNRINLSYVVLSTDIWIVILIGTFLTLGINFLFKMKFSMHLIAVTAASIMAAALVYLLLTLDKPFQGDFVVTPDPLQNVLDSFKINNSPKQLDTMHSVP